jgi:hypothetical protein
MLKYIPLYECLTDRWNDIRPSFLRLPAKRQVQILITLILALSLIIGHLIVDRIYIARLASTPVEFTQDNPKPAGYATLSAKD